MDALVMLIPLMPLVAAAVIGMGQLFGAINGEADESITADIANWTLSMSCPDLDLTGLRPAG